MNRSASALAEAPAGALTALANDEARGAVGGRGGGSSSLPNFLVIILDDVGLEQVECFDGNASVLGTAQLPLDDGPNMYPPVMGGLSTYPYAPTPNLTKLAQEGVRFSRFFTSASCSPSRAQLLTGKYPHRTGLGAAIAPSGELSCPQVTSSQPMLKLDEVTLPRLLSLAQDASGRRYELGYFGKWHLSVHPQQYGKAAPTPTTAPTVAPYGVGEEHPALVGVPFYQGIIGNPDNRPRPNSVLDTDPDFDGPALGCPSASSLQEALCQAGYRYFFKTITTLIPTPGLPDAAVSRIANEFNQYSQYLSTVQRRDVESWILSRDQPWLAVWAASAPHGPYRNWPPGGVQGCTGCQPCNVASTGSVPLAEDLHTYGCVPDDGFDGAGTVATRCVADTWTRYRATLQAFDTEFGALRRSLGNAGQLENTIIIVVGDNGTPQQVVDSAGCQTATSMGGVTMTGMVMFPYAPCLNVEGTFSPTVQCPPPTPPTLVQFGDVCGTDQMPSLNPCAAIVRPFAQEVCHRFKGTPYLGGTNVPLIISAPDAYLNPSLRGTVAEHLVDMVDLFSTIADFAGIPAISTFDPMPMTPTTPAGQWGLLYPDVSDLPNGISIRPVLAGTAMDPTTWTRQWSLSLNFRPNGDFTLRDGHTIGFTSWIDTDGTGGPELVRLVRRLFPAVPPPPVGQPDPNTNCKEPWPHMQILPPIPPLPAGVRTRRHVSEELYVLTGSAADPLEMMPLDYTQPPWSLIHQQIIGTGALGLLQPTACPDCNLCP